MPVGRTATAGGTTRTDGIAAAGRLDGFINRVPGARTGMGGGGGGGGGKFGRTGSVLLADMACHDIIPAKPAAAQAWIAANAFILLAYHTRNRAD